MSFKLDDCVLRQTHLVSLFGITLRFSECGVTKNGHDHLSCCAGFGETTASRLAQSMRLATKRKFRFRYRIAQLGGSTTTGDACSGARRRRPCSAGESQMAVTAIAHDGRMVTVTRQLVENTIQSMAFATNIYGGPLGHSSWQATSWTASLRNHVIAVNKVIEAIALDVDRAD